MYRTFLTPDATKYKTPQHKDGVCHYPKPGGVQLLCVSFPLFFLGGGRGSRAKTGICDCFTGCMCETHNKWYT